MLLHCYNVCMAMLIVVGMCYTIVFVTFNICWQCWLYTSSHVISLHQLCIIKYNMPCSHYESEVGVYRNMLLATRHKFHQMECLQYCKDRWLVNALQLATLITHVPSVSTTGQLCRASY